MTTKEKLMNDFLLTLFTGEDDMRPQFAIPNLDGGFVSATDGHVLIRVPENELFLKYNHNEKYNDVDKMLSPYYDGLLIKKFSLKIEDMMLELTKARMIVDYQKTKCDTCGGYGEEECDLGHMHTCRECDGDGEYDIPIFERIKYVPKYDSDGDISVGGISLENGIWFHPFQFYRLMMVAICYGYDVIELHYKMEREMMVAEFGNVLVVVMPMSNPN